MIAQAHSSSGLAKGCRVSTQVVGRPAGSPARSRRRAALARAALARAWGVPEPDEPLLRRHLAERAPLARVVASLLAAAPRLARHSIVVALVLLVLGAELAATLPGRAPTLAPASPTLRREPVGEAVVAPLVPLSIGPIRLGAGPEPAAPALSQPVELAGPFRTIHLLAAGETLGAIAARYAVTVESLVWANGLQEGDALVLGQPLRVPSVSGVPYVVAAGDTAVSVAERFGVAVEAIASLPSNHVDGDLGLAPGSEIFVPGAQVQLPGEWLGAIGGLDGIAALRAERAAVVRSAQTNLRTGPSLDHPRLAQLDAGRRVALRARNGDWLLVEIGAVRGWMRTDMLDGAAEQVEALPVSNDFPPPPPRWVWPARGTLTSGFGPRWRSFHNGIDIASRAWTPIVAARSGTVKEAGWCSGYGYCVKLRHDGGVETIYGHLIDRPVVRRGDEVNAGELIGHMGSTYDRAGGGYSTGVHLHFTVLVNGKAVNPLRYLP